MKKIITYILLFVVFIAPALAYTYSLSCGYHTLTPTLLSCSSYTYDVLNLDNGSYESQDNALNLLEGSTYNGTYNFTEGNFKVIYCDGSTSSLVVACAASDDAPPVSSGGGIIVNPLDPSAGSFTIQNTRQTLRTECLKYSFFTRQACYLVNGAKLLMAWDYFALWAGAFAILFVVLTVHDNYKKILERLKKYEKKISRFAR